MDPVSTSRAPHSLPSPAASASMRSHPARGLGEFADWSMQRLKHALTFAEAPNLGLADEQAAQPRQRAQRADPGICQAAERGVDGNAVDRRPGAPQVQVLQAGQARRERCHARICAGRGESDILAWISSAVFTQVAMRRTTVSPCPAATQGLCKDRTG